MPRLVLVLPSASYRAAELLAAAGRIGAEVVTVSDERQAFAASSPDRFLEVRLDDPQAAASAIVAAAERALVTGRPRFDGIVSVDDQGLLAAAIAAERLGLPHSPPGAVAMTRDKVAMRRALEAAGVPQPRFAVVGAEDAVARDEAAPDSEAVAGVDGKRAAAADSRGEPARVAEAAGRLGYPVVVKPPNLSGSRGVIRADDAAGAALAAARVRTILHDAGEPASVQLLVEAFVPGDEIAVEGLLRRGHLEVLAVFDKPEPLDGPYFEETIYVTPSRLEAPVLARVAAAVAGACAAIGLAEGPVHAEVHVGPEAGRRPHESTDPAAADPAAAASPAPTDSAAAERPLAVIEVAARTIGGRCAKALRFATGASLDELVIAHTLGLDPVELPPREDAAAGVLMIPIPASGRLAAVDGTDEVRRQPGVTGVELTIPLGASVRALPEGDRYLGFVFARGDGPDEVEKALRRADETLSVRVEQP